MNGFDNFGRDLGRILVGQAQSLFKELVPAPYRPLVACLLALAVLAALPVILRG